MVKKYNGMICGIYFLAVTHINYGQDKVCFSNFIVNLQWI